MLRPDHAVSRAGSEVATREPSESIRGRRPFRPAARPERRSGEQGERVREQSRSNEACDCQIGAGRLRVPYRQRREEPGGSHSVGGHNCPHLTPPGHRLRARDPERQEKRKDAEEEVEAEHPRTLPELPTLRTKNLDVPNANDPHPCDSSDSRNDSSRDHQPSKRDEGRPSRLPLRGVRSSLVRHFRRNSPP